MKKRRKEIDWWTICKEMVLDESFLDEHADEVNWYAVSKYQNLSDSSIKKFFDRLDWSDVLEFQDLSMDSISFYLNKMGKKADWESICRYQVLSEEFMYEFLDELDWKTVSTHQVLTEDFIERNFDKVDLYRILRNQQLSGEFLLKYITNHDDWKTSHENWETALEFQSLSESFIEENWDVLYKFTSSYEIENYQKLSQDFLIKHGLTVWKDNWMTKSSEFKKQQVVRTGRYECYDDYFIAYKGIRRNRYSCWNLQYQYLKGNTYSSHADHTCEECSFGFSVGTKAVAEDYCNELVVRVKVYYKDVARVTFHGQTVRSSKITILD